MTVFCVIQLSDNTIIHDGVGPDAKISEGQALWPIVSQETSLDPTTQRLGAVALSVDPKAAQVISAPTIVRLSQAEITNMALFTAAQAASDSLPMRQAIGAAANASAKSRRSNTTLLTIQRRLRALEK